MSEDPQDAAQDRTTRGDHWEGLPQTFRKRNRKVEDNSGSPSPNKKSFHPNAGCGQEGGVILQDLPRSPSLSENLLDWSGNLSDPEWSCPTKRENGSSPRELDTELGDLSDHESPSQNGESSEESKTSLVSGSTASRGRVRSPLQDALANLTGVVKRRRERHKRQAKELADLLEEAIDKREEDMALLQKKLDTKEERMVRVQGELARRNKALIRVRGELATEKNQSVRLRGKLAAQKKHLGCLQREFDEENKRYQIYYNMIVPGLKKKIQRLESKLQEAEVKIVGEIVKQVLGLQKQIKDLESRLHDSEVKIGNQNEKLLCEICFERPRNALCLPCMHFSFSTSCLEEHLKISKTCRTCPVSTKGLLECYGLIWHNNKFHVHGQ